MPKQPLSKHKTGHLALLAAALFAVAGLLFGRVVDYGQFLHALTGSLTDIKRYSLPNVLPAQPVAGKLPSAMTGKLTVSVSPAAGSYIVLNSLDGSVVSQKRSGSDAFNLGEGNYAVRFFDLYGYDTPKSVVVELTVRGAAVYGNYKPWRACAVSDWNCSPWSGCDRRTGQKARTCVFLNPRCVGSDTVQPPLREDCVPLRR